MQKIKEYFHKNSISLEKICLYKEEKKLEFTANSKHIVSYRDIRTIEENFVRENPDVSKALIKIKYRGNKDKAQLLQEYIPNIEYMLEAFCPAVKCGKDFIDIRCENEPQTELTLDVRDKMVLNSIKTRKIDSELRNIMAYDLGLDVRVSIKDVSVAEDTLDFMNRNSEILKKEAAVISSKAEKVRKTAAPRKQVSDEDVIYGRKISIETVKLTTVRDITPNIAFEGEVFATDKRVLNSGKVIQTFSITDFTNSIQCKLFTDSEEDIVKKGDYIRVRGDAQYDPYARELIVMAKDVNKADRPVRRDLSNEKRVELHLHTSMSMMDAVSNVGDLVKQAKEFGHKAVAITDHGIVQAFPDAMSAGKKHEVKILYGVEAYLIDDLAMVLKEHNDLGLDQTFVVFDIETTGLSPSTDKITEIGAVKIKNREITERFSELVNPQMPIPSKITELTGISNDMVRNSRTIEQVLPDFLEFAEGSMLVAHNSDFDTGFIREACRRQDRTYSLKALDTVAISRALLPELKRHKLNVIAKHLDIKLENHHRAVDDAEATANIFLRFIEMFAEKGIEILSQVNELYTDKDYKSKRPNHMTILVKDMIGLKNLYKIISIAHIENFYKNPRTLKSVLNRHREGLILGSACEAGEVYQAVQKNLPEKDIDRIISYYDYIEIMPCEHNSFMIAKGIVKDENELREINKAIYRHAKRNGKPVVATGDVHYKDPSDGIYRNILKVAQKFSVEGEDRAFYFRTTDEMLEEFSYLGADTAYEVVVKNPNMIADMIEDIKPIPDGTFAPFIEGSDTELREMCYRKAEKIYGNPLPEIVQSRLDRELNSIIGNGYAVMYIIAQKLVTKSIADGYLVGSRGSVGSSFAATMSDITEVNPLCPHYVCASCRYSDFITDGSYASGVDLPDRMCPQCGKPLIKDGHDIPFEVFLGFEGDKEPDIDLNFAGEYQPCAHKYTEELFGEDYVFRAGTIGTVAEKTAYGYVMKYLEETDSVASGAEISRLREGCTGVKRTSGQHPGGVMVVPDYKDVYDFTPIQYPANDPSSGVRTTHFDYHSISGRILKLDILGHDVPTIIKMLEDFTGVTATDIKLDDPQTMSIFTSTDAIGCDLSEIKCDTGSLGIPEFGTKFVRQMLMDTKPTTFGELVRISGLSHGTDVWLNNAQELVRSKVTTLKEVISTRDDIMNYLMLKGVKPKTSFKIMENVRKGKGLTEEHIEDMKAHSVPQWYIESCQKIKYMFPKAHAAAYVMMSFRVAYYKVHHKEAFYATFFTTKIDDFDADIICRGKEHVLEKIKELESLGNNATTKEKGMMIVLEVAYEMFSRGVEMDKVDLYRSSAAKFRIEEGRLLPPLCAIQGLGETVARNIEAEAQREFISLEDFRTRTKANKSVTDILISHGCLCGIPESNQLTLF